GGNYDPENRDDEENVSENEGDKKEEEKEDEGEKDEEEESKLSTGIISIRFVDENVMDLEEPVVQELNLGEYTFEAKSIPGYDLLSPAIQSVTLSEDGEQREVVFKYRSQSPEVKPEKPEPVRETVAPKPKPEPEATVEGIILVAEPYKTTYFIGEELELDGLVVCKVFSDGREEEVAVEDLTITGFNSEKAAEEQIITIDYHGFKTHFTVSIVEKEESPGILTRIFGNPLLILIIALFCLLLILIAILVNMCRHDKPQAAKKREKSTPLIIIAVFVAIGLFAYGGAVYLLAQMEREEIAQDDESLGIEEGSGKPGITNIAIFGVDAKDGMTGRSDAIMVLTLDEKNDKIKITSLLRDSYVNIPGRGMDKINHAYAFGGPELAIRTINENFQLDIRYFVSVDFTSMPAIIDAVGGLEIELTDREAREIPGINSGGIHLLNGEQALRFSRLRKLDSDFERTRRQRDIMEATIESALKTPVTAYPGMLNKVFPHLTTNLTPNQILSIGGRTVLDNIDTIEKTQFPPSSLGKGQMINGVYYYVFDLEEGARRLNQYIYDDQPLE
ncbi:MAG: hypothetical protein GX764_04010, partial [Firmicutes bacterium]|nr:hypothetical protein [Bacillota bacterium]